MISVEVRGHIFKPFERHDANAESASSPNVPNESQPGKLTPPRCVFTEKLVPQTCDSCAASCASEVVESLLHLLQQAVDEALGVFGVGLACRYGS